MYFVQATCKNCLSPASANLKTFISGSQKWKNKDAITWQQHFRSKNIQKMRHGRHKNIWYWRSIVTKPETSTPDSYLSSPPTPPPPPPSSLSSVRQLVDSSLLELNPSCHPPPNNQSYISHRKTNKCIKSYFVHTICHKCDTFRSIPIFCSQQRQQF